MRVRPARTLPARWHGGVGSRRCRVAAFAFGAGAPVTGAPGGPADPGAALGAGAALRPPSPAVVAAARKAGFIRYDKDYPGDAYTNEGFGGGASMVLAAASYAGDTSADARLLEQIRNTIAGGHEPAANGGYPTQHERWVTGMFAVVRHTPRVWNQLSADERHKIDLVMTGALVGSAFTTSDRNPFVVAHSQQYTVDGDDNVDRDWNPNYLEGMVGMLVVAPGYFGGGSQAQAVLDGYNNDAFVAAARAAGLTNLVQTFTWRAEHPSSHAPTGAQLEQAVHGFRYYGFSLNDPMALFRHLTDDTFGVRVNCGLNDGVGVPSSNGQAGIIVSGCAQLPNKGALGMLKELDSVDAGGPRSSALYAYDSYRIHQVNHYVLLASGLWRSGAVQAHRDAGERTDRRSRPMVQARSRLQGVRQGRRDVSERRRGRWRVPERQPGVRLPLLAVVVGDVIRPYPAGL